jgi:hypothetical protein
MSQVFHLHHLAGDFITIEHRGTVLKLTPLTMRGRANIQAAFVNSVPGPVEKVAAMKSKVSPEQYAAAMEHALKQAQYWPPAIDSPEALNVIASEHHLQACILAEMLRKHQPDTCQALAEELMDDLTPQAYAAIGGYGWTCRRPNEPDFQNPPETTGT